MEPSQTQPIPNKSCNTHQSKLSIEELIKLAEQAFEEFSPGIAAKYYEQAITIDPNNALLYHKLGLMYVEHGEPEQAHKSFLKSIELSPNENPTNYLYIGQQCYGNAAKSAFEKGIQLIQNKLLSLKNSNNSNSNTNTIINDLKTEISCAYVSIAELYMTDLCDENDAEIQCEKYLNLSLQFDTNNIETYSTFGEFRHCQQNNIDAIKYFNIALQKLFEYKNSINNDSDEKQNDIDDKLDVFSEKSLTIDSFLKIVKLGIELKQYKQCVIILKNLINSNDSIGECWALGALCFYKLNEKEDAAIWLNNAESILLLESMNSLNIELRYTLETIKNQMDINDLPDLTKLNLEENDNDNDKDVVAFLQDNDIDNDDDDDDDVDLVQSDNNEDIDLNNNNFNNDNDMIDID